MNKFKPGDKVQFITKNMWLTPIILIVREVFNQPKGSAIYYCTYPDSTTYYTFYDYHLKLVEEDEKPQGLESAAALAFKSAYPVDVVEKLIENQEYITKYTNNCECGKEKHGFASHSNWCPKHE